MEKFEERVDWGKDTRQWRVQESDGEPDGEYGKDEYTTARSENSHFTALSKFGLWYSKHDIIAKIQSIQPYQVNDTETVWRSSNL